MREGEEDTRDYPNPALKMPSESATGPGGLCRRQFAIVQVHVALRRRDVCVPQQPASVFNPLQPADSRPAFVAGQIQHEIARELSNVAMSAIRATEILDAPFCRSGSL